MASNPILFLNFNQSLTGRAGPYALPRDYMLACRFFHCGIIDRTRILNSGFPYTVLDELPPMVTDAPPFAALCDARGVEIVEEARESGKKVAVLWSGGIDSTAALIAVMKAAVQLGFDDQVVVMLSMDSVLENPSFFLQQIRPKYRTRAVTHPVSAYLDSKGLTVTGEHGDQLFGSHLLESYVRRGLAGTAYEDILPLAMVERLRNPLSVYRLMRYLEPLFRSAPVPIRTLFDAMWWLNFTLKWQEVALRLPVFRGNQASPVHKSLRHFFRTTDFQRWSMANPAIRDVPVWSSYKDVAKHYILEYTGDRSYYLHKEKEDSLRKVMSSRVNPERFRIVMDTAFLPRIQPVDPPPDGRLQSARDTFRGMRDKRLGASHDA
jgi:hypothetical protein